MNELPNAGNEAAMVAAADAVTTRSRNAVAPTSLPPPRG